MNIIVKRAKLADLNEIALLFDAYRVFYKQQSDVEIALKFIKERFNNSESVIFYAKNENGKYVGFTQLYPSFSSVSVQRTWVLNDLFVLAEMRSLGVGKKLLNKAKEFALETKAKGIALETAASNTKAQKLYESIGYTRDSEFSYFLNVN
ncbi:MAG: GNAT family N-acetyltransferase [Alcanivoracaceae bacterium]|nr:GNAT family N-acetyltransferase [Alcanivoracaceae bacterium]